MINFIIQAVADSFPEHDVSFVRDNEMSAQFAPVFIVKVSGISLLLFNSAIINEKSEKHSLSEVVAATINDIIVCIQHAVSLQSNYYDYFYYQVTESLF